MLVVLAAVLALAGAGVGIFSGTNTGLLAAVLCLVSLVPLGLLYKSIRAVMDGDGEAWREPLELALPVADEARQRDDHRRTVEPALFLLGEHVRDRL